MIFLRIFMIFWIFCRFRARCRPGAPRARPGQARPLGPQGALRAPRWARWGRWGGQRAIVARGAPTIGRWGGLYMYKPT